MCVCVFGGYNLFLFLGLSYPSVEVSAVCQLENVSESDLEELSDSETESSISDSDSDESDSEDSNSESL